MENLTSVEEMRNDPQCDRTISLYGYMRGAGLKQDSKVHIPGMSCDHVTVT